MRAVVVDGAGLIVNDILVQDLSFAPGAGLTLVGVDSNAPVTIGWTYASGTFSPPAPVSMQSMSQAAFVVALGPNLLALWGASTSSSEAAQFMSNVLTVDPVDRSSAYADMQGLEDAGTLPSGTTAQVWGP